MGELGNELAGKVAVVTGAGRNIGRAIALDLADAGASVVINTRSNKDEAQAVVGVIEQAGGKAAICMGDVADPATGANLAKTALEKFGRLDIVVSNAALRSETAFDKITFEEWRRITGTVLDGAFHVIQGCLPALKQSGVGSIITIGGMSGHTGAKDRAHVVTAKSGLVGLTRALAHEFAEFGITVNCVVPGMIDTPHGKPQSKAAPQHYQFAHAMSERKGTTEELASLVRYLCSPGARYITGQDIHVNGGAYLG